MARAAAGRGGEAAAMTSHERFEAACRRRTPDRVPIDYMAGAAVTEKLKTLYQVSTERELLDRLACDFYYLSCRDISQNETSWPIYRGPKLDVNDSERTCPFGIRYQRKVFADKFGADETVMGPLSDADSVQDVLDHPLPDPEWFDVSPLAAECEEFSDKVIVGGFWTAIFGNSYRMMGLDKLLLNMAMRPEIVKALVDRMTDFYLELNDRVFSALKGKLRIYFLGNDWGTQKGLLFSREMWFDFFFENYKRLIAHAHGYGLKVMTHSCGAILPLIDPLIEAGVDILDPVQTTAEGMQAETLKQRFGDRLVFHGAIDTQQVLPNETPEGVYAHAAKTIEVLGRTGGYIFSSCNNIQEDTPLENIDAMYRAAKDSRRR
jgi:uroporphyrinogen decarboxylase